MEHPENTRFLFLLRPALLQLPPSDRSADATLKEACDWTREWKAEHFAEVADHVMNLDGQAVDVVAPAALNFHLAVRPRAVALGALGACKLSMPAHREHSWHCLHSACLVDHVDHIPFIVHFASNTYGDLQHHGLVLCHFIVQ